MSTLPYGSVSSCRHCQLYRAEGRRGGHCQQLNVPVQGSWKSCSLVVPPFASVWRESDLSFSSSPVAATTKLLSESEIEAELKASTAAAGVIDVAQVDLELMSVAHLLAR